MTHTDGDAQVRDAGLPGRLLTTERDALVPLLRGRAAEDFGIRTRGCPEWTVRDVLAHCSAALMRVVEHGSSATPRPSSGCTRGGRRVPAGSSWPGWRREN